MQQTNESLNWRKQVIYCKHFWKHPGVNYKINRGAFVHSKLYVRITQETLKKYIDVQLLAEITNFRSGIRNVNDQPRKSWHMKLQRTYQRLCIKKTEEPSG